MTLLLDTHALLWWLFDDPSLSERARAAITERANTVVVSSASAWEIATKWRLGRLREAEDAVHRLPALLHECGFETLPISIPHALAAGALTTTHRDPFDRMLIAQATLERLTLVTKDTAISTVFGDVLW
jgi:PIN domain nuclease of toxin-antitoxin system